MNSLIDEYSYKAIVDILHSKEVLIIPQTSV